MSNKLICCAECKTVKSSDKFYVAKSQPGGYSKVCKECNAFYTLRVRYRRIIKTKGKPALATMIQDKERQIDLMIQVLSEAT